MPVDRLRFVRLVPVLLFMALMLPVSVQAQIASEQVFDLQWVDLYAELTPEKNEAQVIAHLYLDSNGVDPVVFRLEGNFLNWRIYSYNDQQPNLAFRRDGFYFWLYNLASGPAEVVFEYQMRRQGWETANGAVISPTRLDLGPGAFWYPRNVASDSHQAILNLVTPPDYPVYATASLTRDLPHNFKRLRTYILRKATQAGISLSSSATRAATWGRLP